MGMYNEPKWYDGYKPKVKERKHKMNMFERFLNFYAFPFEGRLRKWYYGIPLGRGFFFRGYCPKFTNDIRLGYNVMLDFTGGLTIGNDVTMGDNVRVYSHTHHFSDVVKTDKPFKDIFSKWKGNKNIKIGNRVFIGDNCLIFKSIPDNTFIPAGTVWK